MSYKTNAENMLFVLLEKKQRKNISVILLTISLTDCELIFENVHDIFLEKSDILVINS